MKYWRLYPQLNKYLIKSGEKYYNIVNDSLNEINITALSAQTFLEYGNDSFPDKSLIIPLNIAQILFWTDETESAKTLKIDVRAVPFPQDVISGIVDLTHESITGIESVEIIEEGSPLYAVSFDNQKSWNMIVGDEWVVISDEHNGMTSEVITSIPTSKWGEKVSGIDGLYIRFSLFGITDKVTEIKVNYTN